MKIIVVFAFLALAYAKPEAPQVQSIVLPEAPKPLVASPYAGTVKIAAPIETEVPTSANSAGTVKVAEFSSYKDIPAANPRFEPNVPILRSDVAYETPVVVHYGDENAAPQYPSPIDIGMVFVPEEVMRAIAAADAMNAEPVPFFPALEPDSENVAVKVADSPVMSKQVIRAAPSETVQVQPVVLPEPAKPLVESEDVAFNSPRELEQILRVAPVELEAVRIEAPQVVMQVPVMPFFESEDTLAVKIVDSPSEDEQVMMVAPLELEAVRVVEAPVEVEYPKQFVDGYEAKSWHLLQNGNRPYPVYNNPLWR